MLKQTNNETFDPTRSSVIEVDLNVWRTIPAVIGLMLLVYGLIWESAR